MPNIPIIPGCLFAERLSVVLSLPGNTTSASPRTRWLSAAYHHCRHILARYRSVGGDLACHASQELQSAPHLQHDVHVPRASPDTTLQSARELPANSDTHGAPCWAAVMRGEVGLIAKTEYLVHGLGGPSRSLKGTIGNAQLPDHTGLFATFCDCFSTVSLSAGQGLYNRHLSSTLLYVFPIAILEHRSALKTTAKQPQRWALPITRSGPAAPRRKASRTGPNSSLTAHGTDLPGCCSITPLQTLLSNRSRMQPSVPSAPSRTAWIRCPYAASSSHSSPAASRPRRPPQG